MAADPRSLKHYKSGQFEILHCEFIFSIYSFYLLWMLLEQHSLCHRMCKVTKESSGANKIMRNAINFTSITLRWTSSSSRQSVFSKTSDGSQRSPNGGESQRIFSKMSDGSQRSPNGSESQRSVYLVKIGPK